MEGAAGQPVLVGALASGVNRQTWAAFRNVMLALSLVLVLQLAIALQSNSSELLLHVFFLTTLAAALFLLLRWFILQTGFVTVKQQMDELGDIGHTDRQAMAARGLLTSPASHPCRLQIRAVGSEDEEFEARLARIQRRSGSGKKATLRKARKEAAAGSKGQVLLPPVPLEDPVSDGLVVELGFNAYTERLNGRFASLGLAAILLVELASGTSFLKYHEPAIIGIQAYTVLAIAALFVKYEKENKSVWPKP